MEKDYENFVQRMGSFEMDLDDMFGDNEVLKHYAQDKFLVHKGVKGMKWGVRRERKKAFRAARKQEKRQAKLENKKSEDRVKSLTKKYKNREDMSITELREFNERVRLENELGQNISQTKTMKEDRMEAYAKGLKLTGAVLTKGLKLTGAGLGVALAVNSLKNAETPSFDTRAGAGKRIVEELLKAAK